MRLLRTLAVPARVPSCSWVKRLPRSRTRSTTPPHYPLLARLARPRPNTTASRRQEGRLFDLGRYRRNYLHRRAGNGWHGSALRQE
jgi:hypothetical protein